MGAFGGGLDHGEGTVLRSRSVFARRCTVSGGVLVVIGVVGIARWWTVSLGLLLLVMAGLVAVIVAEEASYDSDVDVPEPPAEIPSPRTPTERVVRFLELARERGGESSHSSLATSTAGPRPPRRCSVSGRSSSPTSRCALGAPSAIDTFWPMVVGENDWAADRYVANEFGSEDSVVDVPAPADGRGPRPGSWLSRLGVRGANGPDRRRSARVLLSPSRSCGPWGRPGSRRQHSRHPRVETGHTKPRTGNAARWASTSDGW